MNLTMAMCAEVNLYINEAVLVQTELVKNEDEMRTSANTAPHQCISEVLLCGLN